MARPEPHLLHLGLKGTNRLQVGLGFYAAKADADVGKWLDFVFNELLDPVEFLLVLRVGFEIPGHYLLPFSVFFWAAGRSIRSFATSIPSACQAPQGQRHRSFET